jgi:hypothetical protein
LIDNVSKQNKKMEHNNRKNEFAIGGLLFIGFMFLGAGIGMLYNDTRSGGAIGIGVGFIAMGLVKAFYKKY